MLYILNLIDESMNEHARWKKDPNSYQRRGNGAESVFEVEQFYSSFKKLPSSVLYALVYGGVGCVSGVKIQSRAWSRIKPDRPSNDINPIINCILMDRNAPR
jgi:hypothetical protein